MAEYLCNAGSYIQNSMTKNLRRIWDWFRGTNKSDVGLYGLVLYVVLGARMLEFQAGSE
jgi:hypothetical protein